MIICFECSQLTKRILDEIVSKGQYEDYGEAITTAIENLGVLHRELTGKGSLIIESHGKLKQEFIDNVMNASLKNDLFTLNKNKSKKEEPSIPGLFRLNDFGKPPHFAPIPEDNWSFAEAIPLNKWIFAMYNRLLPAKVNCRALAHMQNDLEGSVPYNQIRLEISKIAGIFGDYLRKHDKNAGLNRDDAFATAFPHTGKGSDKSMERYLNQFLGYVNKEGNIESLLYSFKLINYEPSENPKIMLTEAGWKFASLENNILDSQNPGNNSKLSSQEIDCLLQHISHNVPVENYAYTTIIKLILNGNDSPSNLDNALKDTVKVEQGTKLTESFLSSQRSGAVSRMSDLDLIKRIRKGVNINYELTSRAHKYMENTDVTS